ncbi:MAG TPA: HupE/UreJ family protein [Verrucomicrobiae bacterium]|nr:HupE/UreJ family protein [Verrucomicrobiae bacterium]
MKRLALGLALLACTGAVHGHSRGTSYSEWTVDAQGAQVRAHVSQLELTRLQLHPSQPDYAPRVAALLRADVQLWSRQGRCRPGPAQAQADAEGWVYARWAVTCPDNRDFTVRSRLLHAVAPSHLHFARVETADAAVREQVLTHAAPAFEIGTPPDLAASLARYAKLGVEHILSGWDHLAFVLALILLASRISEVALLATGFTVAHSLTLAAAVLGWAKVDNAAIEALIGFSIALVAAENLWLRGGRERWLPWALAVALVALAGIGTGTLPRAALFGLALFSLCYFTWLGDSERPLRLRIALAFAFGLAHGFGFAGALGPLQLPPERIAAGLLGFNLGVELGQLLVIALAWPLLQWLARRPVARAWAGDGVSACICALGTFWFVTRTFG